MSDGFYRKGIAMSFRIHFSKKDCVACNACYEACSDQNDINIKAGEEPFRNGLEYEPRSMVKANIATCIHCTDAACIKVCQHGAIHRDMETGFVVYDRDLCQRCGRCKASCPIDAIHFRVDGSIGKCDGCYERVKRGLLPPCVKCCPTECLRLERVF